MNPKHKDWASMQISTLTVLTFLFSRGRNIVDYEYTEAIASWKGKSVYI